MTQEQIKYLIRLLEIAEFEDEIDEDRAVFALEFLEEALDNADEDRSFWREAVAFEEYLEMKDEEEEEEIELYA